MDGQALWGALSIPLLIALSVLPGSLPVFALPCHGLPVWQRVLLAAAVTPVVVAAEIIALKALGAPFTDAARLVQASCVVGAGLWIWRARKPVSARIGAREIVAVGALVAAVAIVIWIPWAARGPLHYQSAHAVQHAEVTYAVMQAGVAPENGLLAGAPLRYPFAAHYFWAWLAWSLDLNPLVLWERMALVGLATAGFLFHAAARTIGLGPGLAFLALGLLLSGNSPLDAVYDLWVGYRRFEPIAYVLFWQKFTGFTPMWYGLTGLLATLLVCAHLVRANAGASWFALLALAIIAAGVPYPVAFPLVWAAAGALLVARPPGLTPQQTRRRTVLVAAALGGAGAVAAGAWLFFVAGRQGSTLEEWTLDWTLTKLVRLGVAFAPYLLIALPELIAGLRRREPETLLLSALVALGAGFYIVLPLSGSNEYKGIYFAMPGLALLAARSLGLRVGLRRASTLAVAGVLACAVIAHGLARNHLGVKGGPGSRPLAFDTSALGLALSPKMPQAGWTTAIREETPLGTVVVTPATGVPVAAVTQRAEYVARWPLAAGRPGYGYRPHTWAVEVRGGMHGVFRGRKLQLERYVYGQRGGPHDFDGVLASFGTLDRPFALFFRPTASAFLAYLKERGIGRPLWVGRAGVVWFIEADELP